MILSEPNIEFWYSPLLKLETILLPSHYRNKSELAFYDEYFKHAQCYGTSIEYLKSGSRRP